MNPPKNLNYWISFWQKESLKKSSKTPWLVGTQSQFFPPGAFEGSSNSSSPNNGCFVIFTKSILGLNLQHNTHQSGINSKRVKFIVIPLINCTNWKVVLTENRKFWSVLSKEACIKHNAHLASWNVCQFIRLNYLSLRSLPRFLQPYCILWGAMKKGSATQRMAAVKINLDKKAKPGWMWTEVHGLQLKHLECGWRKGGNYSPIIPIWFV